MGDVRMILCPDCATELEDPIDTTFSNCTTARCVEGEHTGDIYECKKCDKLFIDDLIINSRYEWSY